MEEKIINEDMFVEAVSDNVDVVAEGMSKTSELGLGKAVAITVGGVIIGYIVIEGGKWLFKKIGGWFGKRKPKRAKRTKKKKDELEYNEVNVDDLRTDDLELDEEE